jgi:hypothetical protein
MSEVALLNVLHFLGCLCAFSTYFHYGPNRDVRNMCRIIVGKLKYRAVGRPILNGYERYRI